MEYGPSKDDVVAEAIMARLLPQSQKALFGAV